MPTFSTVQRRVIFVLAGIIFCALLGLDGNVAAGHGSTASLTGSTKVQPQILLVTTDKGRLEGRTTGVVDQFLGIPYAQPPVGLLRWAAPAPMNAWTGVRSALSYGNRCSQLTNGNGPRVDDERSSRRRS
jgi:para-nitrobenzyl esterase